MPKTQNLFLKYYLSLNELDKANLREKLTAVLEMSENSFWRKIKNQKWKTIEKEKIAKAAKMPVTELFPELQKQPA